MKAKNSALVLFVAALTVFFSLQTSQSLAQSVPPEFTRPLGGDSKATATPEEKNLFTPLLNGLDFKNKPATIERLTAFIAEHPDIRFGYSLRAAAVGCETPTPDVQMAYDDSKHALALPKDSFNNIADDTTIAAKAALRLNKPKESVALLADAIIRNAGDSRNLLQSSSGKVAQEDPSLCAWGLADFDAMATALPNDWRVPLIRGMYYASLPNFTDDVLFAKAVSEFRKAAVLNPRSPVPQFLIGDVLSKQALFSKKSMASAAGKHIESLRAVPYYTAAIRIDPSYTLAYFNRAESFLEASEDDSSIRDFNIVIEREPTNTTAFADRGNAFVDLHQYYRAIGDFSEAIRQRDSLVPTLLEKRADAYLAAHDERAAVDDYTDAIALTLQQEITMVPVAQYKALYPEYSALSEAEFLQVFRQRFAPESSDDNFRKLMAYPSKWFDSLTLEELYEKRGDAYLRLNNFAAALDDFNRIYHGLPKLADSIERWRDIGEYSLDVKTSVASGNAPNLWVKKTDKLGGYSVLNFTLNCSGRQIKQAAAYRYSKDGEVKGDDGEGSWNGIIPESFGERLWEAGCKRSR